MNTALHLYAESLRSCADGRPIRTVARFRDGTTRGLEVTRWAGAADAVDEHALGLLPGPVLDVGCGPGRHLHALARRGIFAIGVDLCPFAVKLARDGGARAIVGSIFADVPHPGAWRSALLLDGNIGIGGRPVRLLNRIAELLAPGGTVLVELAAPDIATIESTVRLETPFGVSDWFAWAQVSAAAIDPVAADAGFEVVRRWHRGQRWLALLVSSSPLGADPGLASGR